VRPMRPGRRRKPPRTLGVAPGSLTPVIGSASAASGIASIGAAAGKRLGALMHQNALVPATALKSIPPKKSGLGIKEHPPARCRYVNDWRCECGWWNREWYQKCGTCGKNFEEGRAYIAGPEDGEDGKLPHAPEKDDSMSEAQKRSKFFATHDVHWKKQSSKYRSR
jgi:hypothetical protein